MPPLRATWWGMGGTGPLVGYRLLLCGCGGVACLARSYVGVRSIDTVAHRGEKCTRSGMCPDGFVVGWDTCTLPVTVVRSA
eukprot:621157-Alexandrium_andersonii.AAC.1